MAKDPACLWYWNDWHSGTALMSRYLKGCYMDILHAQFNHGHLSIEEIRTVLGTDFGTSWPALQKKFALDAAGKFFNERLEQEKIKRSNFVASRSNGKAGRKKSYDKSHDFHMNNHTEDENENENEIKKNIEPIEIGKVNGHRITVRSKYLHERPLIIHDLAEHFRITGQLDDLQNAGWTDFEGFMKINPGKCFDDADHVYNTFRKHSTEPKSHGTVKRKTNSDEVIGKKSFASKL